VEIIFNGFYGGNMNENLLRKIAGKIVAEHLSLGERETVLSHAGPESLRFAEHMAYECAIRGAHPIKT